VPPEAAKQSLAHRSFA